MYPEQECREASSMTWAEVAQGVWPQKAAKRLSLLFYLLNLLTF